MYVRYLWLCHFSVCSQTQATFQFFSIWDDLNKTPFYPYVSSEWRKKRRKFTAHNFVLPWCTIIEHYCERYTIKCAKWRENWINDYCDQVPRRIYTLDSLSRSLFSLSFFPQSSWISIVLIAKHSANRHGVGSWNRPPRRHQLRLQTVAAMNDDVVIIQWLRCFVRPLFVPIDLFGLWSHPIHFIYTFRLPLSLFLCVFFFSSRNNMTWKFSASFFFFCNLPSFHVNRTIHTVETNTEPATAFFEIIFCQCSLHKRKKMYSENWGEKTLAENKSWMSS